MSDKMRADVALVERGLAESRVKAQASIMAGLVYVDEKRVNKASDMIRPEDNLLVRGNANPFASRGGLKLEKAIKSFSADLTGKVCMDIGCATGGFTDVCLQNGAAHVYAIDVGYGQFAWKLRNDPRVTLMERTNARHLTPDMVPLHPTVTVMDVSFISIKLILPVAAQLMGEEGVFYTLVKPQFEAGRDRVGKKGVVRDPKVHEDVLKEIVDFAPTFGWQVQALDFSPIKGPEGNIEFLAKITPRTQESEIITPDMIHDLVARAHQEAGKTETTV
ncbi:MAG: TlyA family RNA methyltransferase [Clostridiales bacterium]|nr:TlyA family RNA methyltransferase [Clostridiales bacterium]